MEGLTDDFGGYLWFSACGTRVSDIISEFKGIANQTFRQRAWSQEKELIAQVATFRSSQARLRALSEHVTHSIGRYPA